MGSYDADADIRLRHLCEVANDMTDDELPLLQALLNLRERNGRVDEDEVMKELGEAGEVLGKKFLTWTVSCVSVENLSPDPEDELLDPETMMPAGTQHAAEMLWRNATPGERAGNLDLRDLCEGLGVNIARVSFLMRGPLPPEVLRDVNRRPVMWSVLAGAVWLALLLGMSLALETVVGLPWFAGMSLGFMVLATWWRTAPDLGITLRGSQADRWRVLVNGRPVGTLQREQLDLEQVNAMGDRAVVRARLAATGNSLATTLPLLMLFAFIWGALLAKPFAAVVALSVLGLECLYAGLGSPRLDRDRIRSLAADIWFARIANRLNATLPIRGGGEMEFVRETAHTEESSS